MRHMGMSHQVAYLRTVEYQPEAEKDCLKAGVKGDSVTGNSALVRCSDPGDRPEKEEAHVTTAVAPSPPFTALDRCDRCGAQAYVRVELASGGELLFCAHHAREHAEKLQDVAASIQDGSGQLAKTPRAAPDDEH